MEIEAAVQRTFATGSASGSVAEAARRWMALPDSAARSSCLLVLESNQLKGVVLPRDLLRALATQPSRLLGTIAQAVQPILLKDLGQWIGTIEGLRTLLDLFTRQGLDILPVVDGGLRPLGVLPLMVVSQELILRLQQQADHRDLAEQQLMTAYAEMRGMLEALPDLVLELSTEQAHVRVMPTQLAQVSNHGGELINQMVEILTDSTRSGPWLAAAREAIRQQRSLSLEYSLRLGEQEAWFIANIAPTSHSSVIWVARDISDRKRAERALAEANVQLKAWIDTLERRNQELKLLGDLSGLLQTCLSIAEAGRALPSVLMALFPRCSGGVFLYDDSKGVFSLISQWGDSFSSQSTFAFRHCWALRRGRSHRVEAGPQNLRCQHAFEGFIGESLCMPLVGRGQTLGLLHLCTQPNQRLISEYQPMATAVAEHLGLALSDMQSRQKHNLVTLQDEDAQLFNRQYLEQRLQRDLLNMARAQQPLSLLAIALDGLAVAERLSGQDTSRYLLQRVVMRLRNHISELEALGRYGKYDLVLLLPNTEIEEACRRAERLRQLLSSLDASLLEFAPQGIGVAIGIASFPDHGRTAAELLHRADVALYRARSGKGNGIVPYSLPDSDRA
ncbi:MAG: diguanylate cyclase domain-containing protein [Limnothrix sp. BL-A-16]|jgi:diguanylate cyclase (GGDEF)-like protein